MLTLMLGFAVAGSDDKSWTVSKKALAITQIMLIDCGVVMLCCWQGNLPQLSFGTVSHELT